MAVMLLLQVYISADVIMFNSGDSWRCPSAILCLTCLHSCSQWWQCVIHIKGKPQAVSHRCQPVSYARTRMCVCVLVCLCVFLSVLQGCCLLLTGPTFVISVWVVSGHWLEFVNVLIKGIHKESCNFLAHDIPCSWYSLQKIFLTNDIPYSWYSLPMVFLAHDVPCSWNSLLMIFLTHNIS